MIHSSHIIYLSGFIIKNVLISKYITCMKEPLECCVVTFDQQLNHQKIHIPLDEINKVIKNLEYI